MHHTFQGIALRWHPATITFAPATCLSMWMCVTPAYHGWFSGYPSG